MAGHGKPTRPKPKPKPKITGIELIPCPLCGVSHCTYHSPGSTGREITA